MELHDRSVVGQEGRGHSVVHPWLLVWAWGGGRGDRVGGGVLGTYAFPRGREETVFPFGVCVRKLMLGKNICSAQTK